MHSGGHYGFITNACFDPKEKVGAIVLLERDRRGDPARDGARRHGTGGREGSSPAIDPPPKLPKEWRSLLGLYLAPHFGAVVRLEWKDGKLTFLDDTDPTWMPTLAPTDEADVFTVEPGFRESGELVRFQRGKDGRVVSVLAAVATLERLEPVSS